MLRVAILIITHKEYLTPPEKVSLHQCYSILGVYDIRLIMPRGMNSSFYREQYGKKIDIDYVNPECLSTYRNFNRFKISLELYENYSKYDYVLFYEPDAFVFSDELIRWCEEGSSYIGAPWVNKAAKDGSKIEFKGIGNGGFSLRKVDDHIRVLKQYWPVWSLGVLLSEFPDASTLGQAKLVCYDFPRRVIAGNIFHHRYNKWQGNEDLFWYYASKNFTWFTVPEPIKAIEFAFEAEPRYLFELSENRLPFGVHGWWKHDISFWRPHIEKFGYVLR